MAAVVLALALALAAPAQAAPTGLIGKWVVVPEPDRSCPTASYVWTTATETSTSRATDYYPSSTVTTTVRFVGDAHEVYAVGPGGPGGAIRWEIIDANHVKDTSFTGCTYQRTR